MSEIDEELHIIYDNILNLMDAYAKLRNRIDNLETEVHRHKREK